MRDPLERSGVEGSGAYNYYDSRVRKGQVSLEYEIVLARELLSCGLDVRRVDEIGSEAWWHDVHRGQSAPVDIIEKVEAPDPGRASCRGPPGRRQPAR